jgi:hypothetical protein
MWYSSTLKTAISPAFLFKKALAIGVLIELAKIIFFSKCTFPNASPKKKCC